MQTEEQTEPKCPPQPEEKAAWRPAWHIQRLPRQSFRVRLSLVLPNTVGLPHSPEGTVCASSERNRIDERKQQNHWSEDPEQPTVVEAVLAGEVKREIGKAGLYSLAE